MSVNGNPTAQFGMSVLVKRKDLKIDGFTKSFVRVADSGHENTGVFCPEYGVRINNTPEHLDGVLTSKLGTLDGTNWLRPTVILWSKSA